MQTKKMNKKKIWIIVLLLLVCVAATTFTLMNRLELFMPNAKGAIELMDPATNKALNGAAAGSSAVETPAYEPHYSFEAYDDNGVWEMETNIELFCISYENGEAVATVQSGDGDKVIAPGTDNSYVFKLKNSGEAAVDYTVTVDAYCTPADVTIPIEAKLSRYGGKWVVGSAEAYADTAALNAAEDSASLGAGRYTYYTLDWQWPFEGDDELDTMLGNMASEQDVVYTIKIRTVATASANDSKDGILIIQTGDDSSMTTLWVLMGVCAVLMMFLLLWKRDDEDEA